ncbi:MAG: gliding motility-associated C-terminal domain-containing protein [Crocinitomicaceae bacterium]|nr:gliding motility-associated C-terminal domain-containing protein [Crocinitomicaceae bacterium]
MKGKDQIEQLFSDKLRNFEANVDPSMWNSVVSQVAAQSSATATSMSIFTKVIIGIGAASIITVGTVILTLKGDSQKADNNVHTDDIELGVDSEEESVRKVVTNKIYNANQESLNEFLDEQIPLVTEVPPTRIEDESIELVETPIDVSEEFVFELEQEVVEQEQEELLKPELIILEESNEIKVEAEEIVLYSIESLPNIFTPNGDGNNDVFKLTSKGLYDFNITVLNSQNKVVFQSNDLNFEWRGQDFAENNCSEGNYVYYITARDNAGNPVNKYSQLVLKR